MRAISLGYHDVLADRAATHPLSNSRRLYALDLEDFRRHLQSVKERNVHVATIARARSWEKQSPVFLTFDDGAECALSVVAGELERHGWRGHFFVTSDWIGRPGFLNKEQIRELHQRGHVIGSHSCSHPARMSRLSGKELMREWGQSCAVLSDILGDQVRVASVADGYYSRRVGQTAAVSGIEVLFTSEPRRSTWVVDGCLVLGRHFIQKHTPPRVSGKLAAGDFGPRWSQALRWYSKKPVKAVTGELYLKLRRYLLAAQH